MQGPISYFGIRFRPLGYQSIIQSPLGEWSDGADTTGSGDLVPRPIIEQLMDTIVVKNGFRERCLALSQVLTIRLSNPLMDRRLLRFVQFCLQSKSSKLRFSDHQCADFGVSARQLRRLTQHHLGLSPKDFSRIVRFQQVLRAMKSNHNAAVWLDHYYDQPHFIREFKKLTGHTPRAFRNLSVLYNR